jgi:trans-aconitate 2-methyltransferase
MPTWDPDLYERFKAYRDRPALDLLLQIPVDLDPTEIWDLGCGTGEHAAVLAGRHPAARVHGLDSSEDMLCRARVRETAVDWVLGDIAQFAPETPPDLIFSNAALQWTADHERLLPRLASMLQEGGVFACQMPTAHAAPWYAAMADVATEPGWAAKLSRVQASRPPARPERYYDWLAPICRQIDIWSTTYLHVLEGKDPVVEWVRGTALRPYLEALDDPAERAAFVEAYASQVRSVLPQRADGTTLLPFPRLFIVARR